MYSDCYAGHMDRDDDLLEALFLDSQVNAALGWPVVAVLGIVLVESGLDGDLQWALFSGATAVVVVLPPLARRSPYVMLPWELLGLASLPVLVRTFQVSTFANTTATYVSIAALALLITAELHVLTSVRVTHWFAVGFVVLATLAVAGWWTVVRWTLDLVAGTDYLTTNDALMWELWSVAGAGLVAGVLFDLYFRDRTKRLRRYLGRRVVR